MTIAMNTDCVDPGVLAHDAVYSGVHTRVGQTLFGSFVSD